MKSQIDVKCSAENKFREGYNCAESVVRACGELLDSPVSDQVLCIASGFGGGLGRAGCMCGALSGAAMVIGILQGRTGKEQSSKPVYASVKEFHDIFRARFGAACCRSLNPHPFGSPEHRHNCLKITGNTADLLAQYIKDNGLEKN